MTRLYVNNFRAALAAAITNSATTAVLTNVTNLPTLAAGEYYNLTIDGGNGTYEIIKVTARTTTTITMVRAQEGTTGVAWSAGAIVELRATATTHVDIEADTRNWNTTGYIAAGGGSSVSSVRFLEASANGTNYVGFQAPATISANKLWVLPAADGSANQVLKTDGSGNLSWTAPPSSTVASDATPSLGGNLNVAGYKITSASNGNVILEPNGTGAILIGGNATQTAEMRYMEDSDNGTNYVGFKAPSAITANKVWELPGADGTSGQFLKTDGSGVLSFATAGGGGGALSFITSGTASSSSSLDFTSLGNYSYIEFVLVDILGATDDIDFYIRTSTDNGSTYDNGATDYAQVIIGRSGATAIAVTPAKTTQIGVTNNQALGVDIGNVAGEGLSGRFLLFNPTGTAKRKMWGEFNFINADGNAGMSTTAATRDTAADVDAVRFLFSSGNIASGSIYVYGLSKT